jgi:hypothetical protein
MRSIKYRNTYLYAVKYSVQVHAATKLMYAAVAAPSSVGYRYIMRSIS